MYKSKTAIKSYFAFSVSIILLCFIGNTVQAAPFECFAVSDLVRIFEERQKEHSSFFRGSILIESQGI